MSAQQMPPNSFLCPITHEIMKDPVICSDGHTYEREAIDEWFKYKETSPLTGMVLDHRNLVSNHALRSSIEEFQNKAKNDDSTLPPPPNNGMVATLSDKVLTMLKLSNNNDQNNSNDNNTERPIHIETAVTKNIMMNFQNNNNDNDNDNNNNKDAAYGLITLSRSHDNIALRPNEITFCLDISGSMDQEATAGSNVNIESSGLSRLDLVKHCVRTAISTLEEHDSIEIISYSEKAEINFPLQPMTAANKKKANEVLDRIKTQGLTNTWDAIRLAIDAKRQRPRGNICRGSMRKNATMILLTDGHSNVNPPGGVVEALQLYAMEGGLPFAIHTVGLGNDLKSNELQQLAQIGAGTFAYINDASMVGTTFNGLLTIALSNIVTKSTMKIIAKNGVEITDILGYDEERILYENKHSMVIESGPIQNGQSRDYCLKLQIPKDHQNGEDLFDCFVTYEDANENITEVIPCDRCITVENEEETVHEIHIQHLRAHFGLKLIKMGLAVDQPCNTLLNQSNSFFQYLSGIIGDSSVRVQTDERVIALLKDLNGECTQAVSKSAWFNKWGQHYFLYLGSAHVNQLRINFKDPGPMVYGSKDVYDKILLKAKKSFLSVPAPTPTAGGRYLSYSNNRNCRGAPLGRPSAPPASMSTYYNVSTGCFLQGNVLMADGSEKKVQDIRKGDMVMTPSGTAAAVTCVWINQCKEGKTKAIDFNGCHITPYHPVRDSKSKFWNFPCSLKKAELLNCKYFYNFVLAKEHIMIINGVECCTLGHGFTEEVVKHAYWGTDKVIKDLQKMKGWETGLVDFTGGRLINDPVTGFVKEMTMN